MPYRKVISKAILDEWLSELIKMLDEIQYTTANSLIIQCLVSLYEYLQAYSEFVLQGCQTLEGVKVVVKSIKTLMGNNDESLNALVNGFLELRNNASHNIISNEDALDYKDFLLDARLITLLNKLHVDKSLIDCLERNKPILFNSTNLNYRGSCILRCSHLLLNLKLSLEEVVSALKTKYDTSIINSCIVEVLHNQHVV